MVPLSVDYCTDIIRGILELILSFPYMRLLEPTCILVQLSGQPSEHPTLEVTVIVVFQRHFESACALGATALQHGLQKPFDMTRVFPAESVQGENGK